MRSWHSPSRFHSVYIFRKLHKYPSCRENDECQWRHARSAAKNCCLAVFFFIYMLALWLTDTSKGHLFADCRKKARATNWIVWEEGEYSYVRWCISKSWDRKISCEDNARKWWKTFSELNERDVLWSEMMEFPQNKTHIFSSYGYFGHRSGKIFAKRDGDSSQIVISWRITKIEVNKRTFTKLLIVTLEKGTS